MPVIKNSVLRYIFLTCSVIVCADPVRCEEPDLSSNQEAPQTPPAVDVSADLQEAIMAKTALLLDGPSPPTISEALTQATAEVIAASIEAAGYVPSENGPATTSGKGSGQESTSTAQSNSGIGESNLPVWMSVSGLFSTNYWLQYFTAKPGELPPSQLIPFDPDVESSAL